jgi:hypothetical protein
MYVSQAYVRARPAVLRRTPSTATVDHREGLLCRSRHVKKNSTLLSCSTRDPSRASSHFSPPSIITAVFGGIVGYLTLHLTSSELVMLASYLSRSFPIVRVSKLRLLTRMPAKTRQLRACQAGAARWRPHIIFDRRPIFLVSHESCLLALHVQSTPINFRLHHTNKGPFTA